MKSNLAPTNHCILYGYLEIVATHSYSDIVDGPGAFGIRGQGVKEAGPVILFEIERIARLRGFAPVASAAAAAYSAASGGTGRKGGRQLLQMATGRPLDAAQAQEEFIGRAAASLGSA